MNIPSSAIKVFPATRRTGAADPFSRLLSESTIVGIINKLVDTDGFVISDEYVEGGSYEFCIYGYYIRVENITKVANDFGTALDIYAKIVIDTSQSTLNSDLYYEQLVGTDSGSPTTTYSGVDFTSTEPTSGNGVHYLRILTRASNLLPWGVPEESKIRFYQSSFDIEKIDGGII